MITYTRMNQICIGRNSRKQSGRQSCDPVAPFRSILLNTALQNDLLNNLFFNDIFDLKSQNRMSGRWETHRKNDRLITRIVSVSADSEACSSTTIHRLVVQEIATLASRSNKTGRRDMAQIQGKLKRNYRSEPKKGAKIERIVSLSRL